MMQRKQRPLPTGGRGQRKMQLFTENYAIGAKLKSQRLQVLQNLIELVLCLFNNARVICQDASFKVSFFDLLSFQYRLQ